MNPGLVTLHNFPNTCRRSTVPTANSMDLAATDILRCRELGVPRYTGFRRLLHLPVPSRSTTSPSNPDWAREIEELYHGDLERST